MRGKMSGFSLVELMIVVAIVGIIAAITFQVAGGNNEKVRRAIAKNVMMEVQSRQEQFFINNRSYTTNLVDLGYNSSPMFINRNGDQVAQGNAFYRISVTVSGFAYTVQAEPINQQSGDECGTLTLASTGARGAAETHCW